MEIGKKLKKARVQSGYTQEEVAEQLQVTRQTISNWENEKSYPDIISVISLSEVYQISLDELLKGDDRMIKHLDETTNVVKSNRKLLFAVIVNILLMALFVVINMTLPEIKYILAGSFSIIMISTATLFYQLIKKF